MKAMVLNKTVLILQNQQPLELVELLDPVPGDNEVLLKVGVCGVCHTELDEIEGRLEPPSLPVVPGHQVVGKVLQAGKNVTLHKPGDRVGVGWIDSACGHCRYCSEGNENLCVEFRATGYDSNGGYIEMKVKRERYLVMSLLVNSTIC